MKGPPKRHHYSGVASALFFNQHRRSALETLELARTIVEALEEKQAEDILLLDIRAQTPFFEYFVICSGASERQLKALVEGSTEAAKKKHERSPRSIEGLPEDGWVLMDFGDVVVHAFSQNKREYYDLEELWGEGKVVVRIK